MILLFQLTFLHSQTAKKKYPLFFVLICLPLTYLLLLAVFSLPFLPSVHPLPPSLQGLTILLRLLPNFSAQVILLPQPPE